MKTCPSTFSLWVLIIGVLAITCLTNCNHAALGTDAKEGNNALPYVIDLKPFYCEVFRDLEHSWFVGYSGRQTIDGLPFDVGGQCLLYGKSLAERNADYPNAISGIKIDRKFDELHLIHSAQWEEYYGCPVAIVRLHYADGTSYDFPIRYNFQVSDWNRLLTENEEIVADPDTKIIWRGPGRAKGTGRLFKTVLHNPFPDKKVDSMEVISARSSSSYALAAATVAKSDPHREVTPPMPLEPSREFDGAMKVHVLDKQTGAPVAGAEIYTAWIVQNISLVGDPVLTGTDGVAVVKYPKADTKDLRIEIGKEGYLTCDDNWMKGWDGGSILADITYQLTPGRDPILDARKVIGHWKMGAGLSADVDVTKSYFYLEPNPRPQINPPRMPKEADTPEKQRKWFEDWTGTDDGKKYVEAQRRGRMLQLKSDGTFHGISVLPGEYILSGMFFDHGVPQMQIEPRTVTVPKNNGNDPDEPVDLGEIELKVPNWK